MAGGIDQSNDGDELAVTHEINVTPFIDVVLVLLIIFMVAAPLATVDVPVDLPSSTAMPQPRPDTPLYLTLGEDLTLSLGDDPVAESGLAAALDAFTKGDKETRIFLRADQTVDYGHLMKLMNALRAAGYLKIALVGLETTDPNSAIGGRTSEISPFAVDGSPAPAPGGASGLGARTIADTVAGATRPAAMAGRDAANGGAGAPGSRAP